MFFVSDPPQNPRVAYTVELPNMVPQQGVSIISSALSVPRERHIQITAHKVFLSYQQMTEQLRGQNFLPPNDHEDSLFERLVYLTLLSSPGEKNEIRMPFTQQECEKFNTSIRLSAKTTRWLKWGAVPFVGFSLMGGATAFAVLSGWSALKVALVTGCVGAVSNIALSILGLMFTGTFPDDSSNAWNEKQNHFHDLKELYHNLSLELIDLYFTKERRYDAEEIARSIPSQLVRARMKQELQDTGPKPQFGSEFVDEILFGSLQEAIDYVLMKVYPKKNLFIKSFILSHEIHQVDQVITITSPQEHKTGILLSPR
jgi:hypothetical protein